MWGKLGGYQKGCGIVGKEGVRSVQVVGSEDGTGLLWRFPPVLVLMSARQSGLWRVLS